MRLRNHLLLFALALPYMVGGALFAQDDWPTHPDSVEDPDIPKGEILTFELNESKVFPGTSRKVWVYVPAQYDSSQPACLYVGQDGIKYDATTVFDNLIHKGDMPVTIGVFAFHGRLKIEDPESQVDRLNRSYEYDSLHNLYAEFIEEDLLPAVEAMKTSSGLPIQLSKRPTD